MLKNSIIVSFCILISRILGLVRDILIASVFGSTWQTDSYFMAIKIPNMFRMVFAENTFIKVFIPILQETKVEGLVSYKKYLNQSFSWIMLTSTLFTVVFFFVIPIFIKFYAYGFNNFPLKLELTTKLTQYTIFYIPLITGAAYYSAVLNSNNKFLIANINSSWMNVPFILGILLFTKNLQEPIFILAYSFIFAGILQFIFPALFLIKDNLLPKLVKVKRYEKINKTVILSLPILATTFFFQLNNFIDSILSSFLDSGAITWINLAQRLNGLPKSFIITAISIVIFPKLSLLNTDKNQKLFKRTMNWAILNSVLLGGPIILLLVLFAKETVNLIFLHNQMTEFDVQNIAYLLMLYSIGSAFSMVNLILIQGILSKQEGKQSTKAAIIGICFGIVLNLILIFPLKQFGLALASSISYMIMFLFLFKYSYKLDIISFSLNFGIIKFFIKLIVSNLVIILVWWGLRENYSVYQTYSVIYKFFYMLAISLVAILGYVLSLFILGINIITNLKFND